MTTEVQQINRQKSLVLASSSGYRRQLLDRLGVPYQHLAPEIDESRLPNETPIALVRRLSLAKARAVAERYPDSLIIASDQVAANDNDVLGKPGDRANALRQLGAASGRTVHFFTGLCVLDTETAHHELAMVPTEVVFRELSQRQLASYVDREAAFDCAGSFKVEGLGISLFKSVTSTDPTALMGLPLIALTSLLEKFNYALLG